MYNKLNNNNTIIKENTLLLFSWELVLNKQDSG